MLIINAVEGQDIAIGDRTLTFVRVLRPGLVEVRIDGEADPIQVSWDRRLQILPGVHITVDRATGIRFGPRAKFFFAAPRSLRIRERPYEPSV